MIVIKYQTYNWKSVKNRKHLLVLKLIEKNQLFFYNFKIFNLIVIN